METPFNDKIESADVAKMPAEYQSLLRRVLAIQADCEIGGPHLYVRSILPTAPSKVDALIVARTAAEEADHYRKVARLAGEIGEDVSGLLSRPNRERLTSRTPSRCPKRDAYPASVLGAHAHRASSSVRRR